MSVTIVLIFQGLHTSASRCQPRARRAQKAAIAVGTRYRHVRTLFGARCTMIEH